MRQILPALVSLLLATSFGCKSARQEKSEAAKPSTQPHPPAHVTTATLKILTYNMHHGEGVDGKLDLPRIAEIIKREKPDLVALQEVDKNAARSGGIDQAAELARLTEMNFAYGAAMPFQGGEYGQAILSKSPISDRWVHFLPQQSGREPRIAVAALLQKPNIWFVSTHLDHELEDVRVRQAKELHRLYGEKKEPVILAGDFNARPTNQTMQVFSAWADAAGTNAPPTIPSDYPRSRIDYILLHPPGAWEVTESRVLDEAVASDHRPVAAALKLRP